MHTTTHQQLVDLGAARLLAFCRQQGLPANASSSASELAQLILQHEQLAATTAATQLDLRISEAAQRSASQDQTALLQSMRDLEKGILQTANAAQLQLMFQTKESEAKLRDNAHDYDKRMQEALHQAEVAKAEAGSVLNEIKARVSIVEGDHERRFKYLQYMAAIVVSIFGFTGIGFFVNEHKAAALVDGAARAKQTNEILASNLALLDSNLRQLELLRLEQRSHTIAEKISFRMAPEEIVDVETQLEEIRPLLDSLESTLNTGAAKTDGSLDFGNGLRQFIETVAVTLPKIKDVRWTAPTAPVATVIDIWQTNLVNLSNLTNLPPKYLSGVRRLRAYREYMIGTGMVFQWNQTAQAENLVAASNHFIAAISLDRGFARPNSGLGAMYSRLLAQEMRKASPDSARIAQYYAQATNLYAQAFKISNEARTRMVILNNQATLEYRWASFSLDRKNLSEAKRAYQKCKLYIAKAKDNGFATSMLLTTEAESLGVEAGLDHNQFRTNRTSERILSLLDLAVFNGLQLEKPEFFLTDTPLKYVNERSFGESLTNLYARSCHVDL